MFCSFVSLSAQQVRQEFLFNIKQNGNRSYPKWVFNYHLFFVLYFNFSVFFFKCNTDYSIPNTIEKCNKFYGIQLAGSLLLLVLLVLCVCYLYWLHLTFHFCVNPIEVLIKIPKHWLHRNILSQAHSLTYSDSNEKCRTFIWMPTFPFIPKNRADN